MASSEFPDRSLLGSRLKHSFSSFWSYEVCKKQLASEDDDARMQALKVLLCGGIAGVVTWASVFPLGM